MCPELDRRLRLLRHMQHALPYSFSAQSIGVAEPRLPFISLHAQGRSDCFDTFRNRGAWWGYAEAALAVTMDA